MYLKNITSVFSGTLFAQAIPIIGSIFIARIFIPTEFGRYSAWLAIVAFVSVIITLRFEAVLAIVEDGVERVKAVFFTFLIAIVMSILIFAISLLGINLPWIYSHSSESIVLWLSIAPAALFLALNQVCQMWAAAEGLYVKLVIMRVVQAAVLIAAQIIIGLKYPVAISLAIGFLIGSLIGLGSSMIIMPRFMYYQFLSIEKIKIFFIRYKKFPLFALPADSINTAVTQLPVLIVSFRFGSEAAGYLALTMRVLGAPIGLIAKAVLDVFKRQAVQDIKKIGNCRRIYSNTLGLLVVSSLILVIGTIYLADEIFRIAFGLEWIVSAQMSKWLLPMFALGMIASPLSYITYLVEKQHIDLIWQICLMLVALVNLNIFSSYQSTLISYSIGYGCMYLIYIFISFRLSNG